MAVAGSLLDLIGNTPLIKLDRLFDCSIVQVYAKCEFLNPTGSIKDRPAKYIVERWLADGTIQPGMRIVESTSGNFGLALALAAKVHKLQFTAIIDPLTTPAHHALMRHYGAEVVRVETVDRNGGYLHTRLDKVRDICAQDPTAVWINQYANPLNSEAHFVGTGAEIIAQIDAPPDVLIAAVSTSGTIMGVGKRLKRAFPRMRVVAVDAVGSVIFQGSAAPRRLPGMGASRVPELLDTSLINRVIYATDDEAISGCRMLLNAEGIMAGGSAGAVVWAIQQLMPELAPGTKVVTLLADRGERYGDLLYDLAPCA